MPKLSCRERGGHRRVAAGPADLGHVRRRADPDELAILGIRLRPAGGVERRADRRALGRGQVAAWPGMSSATRSSSAGTGRRTDPSWTASRPTLGIKEVVELLSSVGFSTPPAWLRPFHALSNGEQFRVTLARTLAECKDLAVIDEFTSVVDRQVAQVGSSAVAKAVRRRGQKFVAVSCHYDIIDWLDPDWIFQPDRGVLERRCLQGRPKLEMEVYEVNRPVWNLFKSHHYLSSQHPSGVAMLRRADPGPAGRVRLLPPFPAPEGQGHQDRPSAGGPAGLPGPGDRRPVRGVAGRVPGTPRAFGTTTSRPTPP